MSPRARHTRRFFWLLTAATVLLAACSSGSATGRKLALVAYSTPKPVYDQLTVDFARTSAGKGTDWSSSYGASGDQSRAVVSHLPADYVAFSLATDMERLVDAHEVATTWDRGPTKGMVSDSVVVLVVRKGNPKHIHGWADIVKPGIKIVTPDPSSSGSARWNIMAAYGQALQNGGTMADGEAYLRKLFAHVVSSPSSGREATSAFTSGTGDVLLSYENEAIFARQKGQAVDYVVPDATLLIENPAAVTTGAPAAVKAFLAYAESRAGQTVFARNGYRPVIDGIHVRVVGANDPSDPFPTPAHLFTIDDLGGWDTVAAEFFDKTNGIVTKIQQGT